MTDAGEDFDRLATEAEATALRIVTEARDAAKLIAEQSRAIAREAFERIKASRARTENDTA
jgi:vacuolar-type H+-ATPase subunit E/Vma4